MTAPLDVDATRSGARAEMPIDAALWALPPSSLEEITATADLQTRVDRKYLVPVEAFLEMVGALADEVRVLEIAGSREFRYESVYFDTPDRLSYLASAHSRRRRFKVRTRTYLDSSSCLLEIKTTGGRGETVKVRWPYEARHREQLTGDARAIVDETLGMPGLSAALEPALTTTYRRSTLLAHIAAFRLTVDAGLVCSSSTGVRVPLDGRLLVETKSRSTPSRPDRLLWAAGYRPVRISKYCVGLAAIHRDLPANKWHRTLQQHLQVR